MNFRIQEEEEEKKITLDMIYACSERTVNNFTARPKSAEEEGKKGRRRKNEWRKEGREIEKWEEKKEDARKR